MFDGRISRYRRGGLGVWCLLLGLPRPYLRDTEIVTDCSAVKRVVIGDYDWVQDAIASYAVAIETLPERYFSSACQVKAPENGSICFRKNIIRFKSL